MTEIRRWQGQSRSIGPSETAVMALNQLNNLPTLERLAEELTAALEDMTLAASEAISKAQAARSARELVAAQAKKTRRI